MKLAVAWNSGKLFHQMYKTLSVIMFKAKYATMKSECLRKSMKLQKYYKCIL